MVVVANSTRVCQLSFTHIIQQLEIRDQILSHIISTSYTSYHKTMFCLSHRLTSCLSMKYTMRSNMKKLKRSPDIFGSYFFLFRFSVLLKLCSYLYEPRDESFHSLVRVLMENSADTFLLACRYFMRPCYSACEFSSLTSKRTNFANTE